jgi:hypothetical protein
MRENPGPTSEGGRSSSSHPETAIMIAGLAAIASVVFGQYAQDIALWSVCAHSQIVKPSRSCGHVAQIEALMAGTVVSTMVAIVAAAFAVRYGKMTGIAALAAIIGALTGSLLALFKAAAKGADYPRPELLAKPLYFFTICVLLFALPAFLLRNEQRRQNSLVELYLRFATAILAGVLIGGVVQATSEFLWKGLRWSSAAKFLVAPSGTVISTAAWAVALFDPWLRPHVWLNAKPALLRAWVCVFGAGAVVLASGYGILFSAPGDVMGASWVGIVYAGLLLPGIVGIAIAVAFRRSLTQPAGAATAATVGAGLAAAAASGVALLRVDMQLKDFSSDDVLPFVLSHTLAGAAVAATVWAADWLTASRTSRSLVGRG